MSTSSDPPWTIRAAEVSDAGDLVEFWSIAGENESRPTDTSDAVVALIERDPDALLVAVVGVQVVGTVIAGWDGWRAHLYRLAVHPEHRGRRVGTVLMDAAEARLAALGATRLDAMVLDGNALGRSLWEARGYRAQDDWSRWVKPVPLR